MKHYGAITAIGSPTVNCYRRLHGSFTAHRADGGMEHRQGAFRVKSYNSKVSYFIFKSQSRLKEMQAHLYFSHLGVRTSCWKCNKCMIIYDKATSRSQEKIATKLKVAGNSSRR